VGRFFETQCIQTWHGEGEVGISEQVAAAAGSVQSVPLAATNC